ncbi:MAG: IclR family transcriptional regulator [bacterium]
MVQVLLKAFDILEKIAQANGQSLTITEISADLGMNQPTAANIINTMISRGYIEHVGKKKGYKLGPNAFSLTNVVPYGKELVNAAKDIMDELTAKLNETCIIGVLRNYKRYILHFVNAPQEVQVNLSSERNVYETASGRLLFAYLNEKERARFISQNGLPSRSLWLEASEEEGVADVLDAIKESGVAITHLRERHVKGFAVPVFMQEKVVAALSIFLPEYRCTDIKEKEIIESLKNASAEISLNLKASA